MINSSFGRYLDADECSIGQFLILHFLNYQFPIKLVFYDLKCKKCFWMSVINTKLLLRGQHCPNQFVPILGDAHYKTPIRSHLLGGAPYEAPVRRRPFAGTH